MYLCLLPLVAHYNNRNIYISSLIFSALSRAPSLLREADAELPISYSAPKNELQSDEHDLHESHTKYICPSPFPLPFLNPLPSSARRARRRSIYR